MFIENIVCKVNLDDYSLLIFKGFDGRRRCKNVGD